MEHRQRIISQHTDVHGSVRPRRRLIAGLAAAALLASPVAPATMAAAADDAAEPAAPTATRTAPALAAATAGEKKLAAYAKKVDRAGRTAAKAAGGVKTVRTMGWGAYKLKKSNKWFTSVVYGTDSQYVTSGSATSAALQAYRSGVAAQLAKDGLLTVGDRSWDSGASTIYTGKSYTCEVIDSVNFFGDSTASFVCAPTSKVKSEQKKISKLVAQYEKKTKKKATGLTFTDSTMKSSVKKYKKYKKTYLHAVKKGKDFTIYFAKAPGKKAKYVTNASAAKQFKVKCSVFEKTKAGKRAFANEPCKRGKKSSTVRA